MAMSFDEWARLTFGEASETRGGAYSKHFLPDWVHPNYPQTYATLEEDYLAKQNWRPVADNRPGARAPQPHRAGVDFPDPGPHRPLHGSKADMQQSQGFKSQRQAERTWKGKKAMLAKGWNPETIKKSYGVPFGTPLGPRSGLRAIDRVAEHPRMSIANQLSHAPKGASKTLQSQMVNQWENMRKYEARLEFESKFGRLNESTSSLLRRQAQMVKQWEGIVKSPKKQLAGQLLKFGSKWGSAGFKFMMKLPK